jgi:hypothetical protein
MSYYIPVVILYTITIRGGKPPYNVTINYGDGTSETLTTSETTIQRTKTYNRVGTIAPNTTVKDSVGQTATAAATPFSTLQPETVQRLSVEMTGTLQSQSSPITILGYRPRIRGIV